MRTGTVTLGDGRELQFYDVTPDATDHLAIIWHHGSPNVGEPPAPLFEAAAARGLRWVGYDRPGYGGSSAQPGRSVGQAAFDAQAVADALDLERYAVLGHSGGGAHALACAALTPDRVVAAVSMSGLAPMGARGLDWFAGLNRGGEAELRAATLGAAELRAHLETAEFDPSMFTDSDWALLNGEWAWFNHVVGLAEASGPEPFIDDDVASVGDWGFDPSDIRVPTLLVHGMEDRVVPAAHGRWLATRIDGAELLEVQGAGHIGVMTAAPQALDWIAARAASNLEG
ncbi:alpha/beta hydrolase [Demequina sp.]|uniref:alpha/beta hydrolase n=1 Tax=Demequina sp. TaxID=2050685 RepID=UPI003D13D33D